MEELVLRTLVLQFDGRVVEIFGNPNNDVVRCSGPSWTRSPRRSARPGKSAREVVGDRGAAGSYL
ncbi:MAG TPA: hypothetical protein VFW50_20095 [Streptosporangiaceae bacterium]|nr:hypothetical protein [Streptosporangiaceae bacterium]